MGNDLDMTPSPDAGSGHVVVPVERLQYIRDLLTEKVQGSHARSPGHNARLVVDDLLSAAPPVQMEAVAWQYRWIASAGVGPWLPCDEETRRTIQDTGHNPNFKAEVRPLYASPVPSSERDDIIEMCRQVATDAAENEDLILKNFAGRPELVGVWQDACNYVFAKLGSLKSQPAQSGESKT